MALSRLVGPEGQVLAVEPIPAFQAIWQDNVQLSGIRNLTLLPYALGGQNTTVQMGTPERNGLLHHGMTKVAASNPEELSCRSNVLMVVCIFCCLVGVALCVARADALAGSRLCTTVSKAASQASGS